MALVEVGLDDKYRLDAKRIFLSGTQALVRLPMLQRERDRAQGLKTAGFISGYRGSPLGVQRRIGPANVEAAGRHLEIVRKLDLDAFRIAVDGSRAFHGLADRLEADPAAGEARQRKAIEAEVEIVLERRGIDHGDHCRREHLLALVRQRRGLAAMVVARERDHATVRRGAGRIGVLEGVKGTVDARSLAVPDAEHAIDQGTGKHPDLLAAPHRSRRQILVEARHEGDVVLLQEGFRPPQRGVVS